MVGQEAVPLAFSYTCREAGLDCDFIVQSTERDEVERIARGHVERAHDRDLSDEEIREATAEIRF